VNRLSLSSYSSTDLCSLGSVVRCSSAGRSGHCCDYLLEVNGPSGLAPIRPYVDPVHWSSRPGPQGDDLTNLWGPWAFREVFYPSGGPGGYLSPTPCESNRPPHKQYIMSSSSSSPSTATASSNAPSSEKTISDPVAAVELLPGHTIEFGTSRIYSGCMQEIQRVGYFGNSVGARSGRRRGPRAGGGLVVFEAFFTAELRLHAHRFIVEVLRRFDVQIHQLS
jgi:hypothetical protein